MILEKAAHLLRADRIYRQPVSLLSKIIISLIGLYGTTQGIIMWSSDRLRWGNPSLAVARDILPYDVWASTSLLFGLLILVGSWTKQFYIRMIGHVGLSAWVTVFSVATAVAMLNSNLAGNLAPGSFLFIAFVIAVLTCVDEGTPAHEFYGTSR